MTKTWFTAKTVDGEGDIAIYDEIGAWGISAAQFSDALKALGKVSHINLSINSPGGSVFDGLAIHNMLKRHSAMVTVRVDGVAASIASVVAMAGDVVLMPDNSFMMIHDPSGVVMGTSRDMRQLADALDKIKTGIVAAYAGKSGLDRSENEAIMTDETWLTAADAADMGFADAVEEPVKIAASFELSKFKNAPAEAGRKKADLSAAKSQKGTKMADKEADGAAKILAEQEAAAKAEADTKAAADAKAKADAEAAEEVAKVEAEKAETPEQIAAKVRKEMGDIAAACAIAGKPGKASEFIAAGKSLSEVLTALAEERQATDEINARNSGRQPGRVKEGTTTPLPKASDIYAKRAKARGA